MVLGFLGSTVLGVGTLGGSRPLRVREEFEDCWCGLTVSHKAQQLRSLLFELSAVSGHTELFLCVAESLERELLALSGLWQKHELLEPEALTRGRPEGRLWSLIWLASQGQCCEGGAPADRCQHCSRLPGRSTRPAPSVKFSVLSALGTGLGIHSGTVPHTRAAPKLHPAHLPKACVRLAAVTAFLKAASGLASSGMSFILYTRAGDVTCTGAFRGGTSSTNIDADDGDCDGDGRAMDDAG